MKESRFTPAPSTPARDPESLQAWGFEDTQFAVQPSGHVMLTGARYPLSGKELPSLLPWIRGVMQLPIPAEDTHATSYPPQVPPARTNAGFVAAAKAILAADAWSTDAKVRLRHGHGHTVEEIYAVRHGTPHRVPDLVVYPASEEQVVALVEAAKAHGVVLVPYGGGTNVTDALRTPDGEPRMVVSVDMTRMDKVLWIDPVNRMACIQAGAVGRHIQAELAKHGFTLGHEPDSIEFSTLGGWIATHASGMKKNKYGNIEDIVLDVNVVTANGLLSRPNFGPRESVALDARRWAFGSEGTLGIVTQAVVKLFPLPEVQAYESTLFPTFQHGYEFLYELSQEPSLPASVRLVDNLQFQFGQALKPAATGSKVLVSKAQKFLVTKVKGFDPHQMVACTFVFEGTKQQVAAQMATVKRLAKKHKGMMAGAENGAKGYQLTFGIAYIRDFVMRHWILGESFETSVPWSQAVAVCDGVKRRIHEEYAKRGFPGKPFVTCRITQLYQTGCAIYFYFGFHHKGMADPVAVYGELEQAARDEILKQGGSLSHHHGVGKIRARFLPRTFSPATLGMAADIKRAVDPANVFGIGNHALATGPHGVPGVAPAPAKNGANGAAKAPRVKVQEKAP